MSFGMITGVSCGIMLLAGLLVLLNWGINSLGKFTLSLDKPNSPKILNENWVLKTIRKFMVKENNLVVNKDGVFLVDSENSDTYTTYYFINPERCGRSTYHPLSSIDGGRYKLEHNFDTVANAKASEFYKKTPCVISTGVAIISFSFITDVLVQWLLWDWLSMLLVTCTTLSVLALRLTTSYLWGNIGKTDKIDERVTKLEESKIDN